MVAGHCRVTGTHTGETMGKPTGKATEFWGMCIIRVRDRSSTAGTISISSVSINSWACCRNSKSDFLANPS